MSGRHACVLQGPRTFTLHDLRRSRLPPAAPACRLPGPADHQQPAHLLWRRTRATSHCTTSHLPPAWPCQPTNSKSKLPACCAQDPRYFTLHDLKRSRQLAGTLFNVLFNLSKFMAYETRDPFVSRQVNS